LSQYIGVFVPNLIFYFLAAVMMCVYKNTMQMVISIFPIRLQNEVLFYLICISSRAVIFNLGEFAPHGAILCLKGTILWITHLGVISVSREAISAGYNIQNLWI